MSTNEGAPEYDSRPWHEKPCSGSKAKLDAVFDLSTGKIGTPSEMGIKPTGEHVWLGNHGYRHCKNCIEATQIQSRDGKWRDAGYD